MLEERIGRIERKAVVKYAGRGKIMREKEKIGRKKMRSKKTVPEKEENCGRERKKIEYAGDE